ncbi:MAG: ABC transporter ATP-binding protein [Roseiflexaceae bacterium]
MTQPNTIIDMRDVDRAFSSDTGVFDINISVPAGTIFGMIGPSGSGKTTTVRLMTGLYRPDRGHVRVLGQDPARFSTRTREQIGYMPQQFVLYPNLTVSENLNFVASLYGMDYFRRRGRLREVLAFVELDEAESRLGSQLSGGMKRRLELACALVHSPRLLFADEPTAGIDPVLRGKFWEHFRALRDQGNTLFVTTQYVGEAAYCDMVGVMRNGRLIIVDTPAGLRRRALGGEVISLTVDPQHTTEATRVLLAHPQVVKEVRRSRSGPGTLYVYVDDAAQALPQVINFFDQSSPIEVRQAEEYSPPFDDVFIMLMEQAEQNDA